MHTFVMTLEQANMIHQLAASQIAAIKNWMVTAVERGDLERAQKLAVELRQYQSIFAAFNMSACEEIAKLSGTAMEQYHHLRS